MIVDYWVIGYDIDHVDIRIWIPILILATFTVKIGTCILWLYNVLWALNLLFNNTIGYFFVIVSIM